MVWFKAIRNGGLGFFGRRPDDWYDWMIGMPPPWKFLAAFISIGFATVRQYIVSFSCSSKLIEIEEAQRIERQQQKIEECMMHGECLVVSLTMLHA